MKVTRLTRRKYYCAPRTVGVFIIDHYTHTDVTQLLAERARQWGDNSMNDVELPLSMTKGEEITKQNGTI